MTTPNDIISRALKDIGALEAGEVPTPSAGNVGFVCIVAGIPGTWVALD